MMILATSLHWPQYLSHHDVTRIGNILWRDIVIVEKADNRNNALEKESDGKGDVVSP
jgi:hypothetical protein